MTTSIESRLSLALAVKLKMMFEEDKKFLTFPLGMGFSFRDLDFMRELELSGLSAKEQLNNKGQFAQLLNIIPQDSPQFSYDATRFLWDELKKTLNNSQWAESAITIEEEKKLLEAEDFLTDVVEDNTGAQVPVNSQAVTAYYQYKGIFDDAEMAYLDEKITIETVTGPDGELLKKEWESYREKQLIDAKDKAEKDWMNLGFKREVEHHQQVKNLLEPKKYLLHYREQYLNELKISDFSDLNSPGHSLYTTFFSPSDIFEPSLPWPTINLEKEEINALVQKAPNDLKNIFNSGQGGSDIESCSLEYNRVVIIRPWLKPEFFETRYWKFPDSTVISDGKIPRQGKIPGYITSMLVARNFKILRKKDVAQPTSRVIPLVAQVPLQQNMLNQKMFYRDVKYQKLKTAPVMAQPRTRISDHRVQPAVRDQVHAQPPPSRRLHAVPMAGRTSFVRVTPAVAPAQLVGRAQLRQVNSPSSARMTKAQMLQVQKSYSMVKYQGTTVQRPGTVYQRPVRREPAPGTPQSQLVTETHSVEGVVILAYICKRVPKSPDPDQSLVWSI